MEAPARPPLRLPPLVRDRHRRRVALHPLAEAAARVCYGYLRDQHGVRTRRPLPRYLSRTLFFLAAAPVLPRLEAQMGDLRVLLNTSDRTLARSVFASGDWDPLLVGTVFEALDRLGYDYRGRTFVEIGANFGIYSLPAVSQFGFARAVAYEPEPQAFLLLRSNIRRNGLGGRVSARRVALSDEPRELLLARDRHNAGDNRIVSELAGARAGRNDVAVQASTFDHEVDRGAIDLADVGLVWLDVQGHEAEVLAGASSLLGAGAPLVLEYSSSMMSPESRGRLEQLVASNFRLLVDLGWCALTNRLRFQPAHAIYDLVRGGRQIETDLLVL